MRKVLNRGFSLIETLFAVGLTALVGLAVVSVAQHIRTVGTQVDVSQSANNIRSLLIGTLSSSQAWARTVTENPTLACLAANTDCRNQGGPVRVFDAESAAPIVDTASNTGFDSAGAPCSTFNGAAGSADCPLRMNVRWDAVCPPAGPCMNPQVKLTATLQFMPAGSIAAAIPFLNTRKYSFSFIRGDMHNTLEGSCAALQGTFDPATRTCLLKMVGQCPPNTVVKGLTPDNNKICGFPIPVAGCPAGQLMTGVQADGSPYCDTIICAGYCPPPAAVSCPPVTPYPPGPDSGGASDGGCDGADGGDGSDGCDGGV